MIVAHLVSYLGAKRAARRRWTQSGGCGVLPVKFFVRDGSVAGGGAANHWWQLEVAVLSVALPKRTLAILHALW